MDNTRYASPDAHPAVNTSAWPVAGLLLAALNGRDFDAMKSLLAEDIRFRALIPPGPFELDTADATAARFSTWFGGEDDFELVDASLGQIGARIYARWRIRMSPAGRPDRSRIAEQHVFATGTDRITALDLLCSGFQREPR